MPLLSHSLLFHAQTCKAVQEPRAPGKVHQARLVSSAAQRPLPERSAALKAASPDLKYHLSEVKVPVEVQAAVFHKGFVDLKLFAGLDESRSEVRTALAVEIGLKHDESTDARQNVAGLLSAWESSRAQLVAEDKMKAESKLGQTPRIVQCSEMAALREAVEDGAPVTIINHYNSQ